MHFRFFFTHGSIWIADFFLTWHFPKNRFSLLSALMALHDDHDRRSRQRITSHVICPEWMRCTHQGDQLLFLDLRNGHHSHGKYARDRSKNKLITSHEPGGKRNDLFPVCGKKYIQAPLQRLVGRGSSLAKQLESWNDRVQLEILSQFHFSSS